MKGDRNGEVEMGHQKRNDTVEGPDDFFTCRMHEPPQQGSPGVRACVMKSIPKFMRGAYSGAMKLSLQKIQRGSAAKNTEVDFILSLAHVVALESRSFGRSKEIAGAHVRNCVW